MGKYSLKKKENLIFRNTFPHVIYSMTDSNVHNIDTIIKDFPVLYKHDKNGTARIWRLQVIKSDVGEKSMVYIATSYGQAEGKITKIQKEIKAGKNIGKKNETSVEEQAIKDATRLYIDKIEKELYVASEPDTSDTSPTRSNDLCFKPMLAHTFEPESKTKSKVFIQFPCYIQPKLDGIRCLTYVKEGVVVNQSRQLKYFKHLDHINKELQNLFKMYPDLVLDGELYNHHSGFNSIAGIVKKEKLKDEDVLRLKSIQYHVYDCFFYGNMKYTFWERLEFLNTKVSSLETKTVFVVCTHKCENKEMVFKLHDSFIVDMYEGSILRNVSSTYEFNRSKNLQKYKTFLEDEFQIIGFKEGTGLDSGTVIWRCKTTDNKEFDVRPIGTVEERKLFFKEATNYVGKSLTVTYQELSEYGIPRFGVGKCIRDYE